MLSTREDHIAPWKSTYAATQIFGGPMKFVLSASGHIAGVVNPPAAKNTATGPTPSCRKPPTRGWKPPSRHRGPGGRNGREWLQKYGGGKVDARFPGTGGLPAIEEAPGRMWRCVLPENGWFGAPGAENLFRAREAASGCPVGCSRVLRTEHGSGEELRLLRGIPAFGWPACPPKLSAFDAVFPGHQRAGGNHRAGLTRRRPSAEVCCR